MRDRLGRSAGRITGCGNHYHESNVCVAPLCVFLGIGWFEITPLELVRDEVIQAPKIEGIMMSYNSYRKKESWMSECCTRIYQHHSSIASLDSVGLTTSTS